MNPLVVLVMSLAVPLLSGQAPEPALHKVSIRGMVFVPATLEVRVGDTIEWVNDDVVPHTATAVATGKQGPLFDSGVMGMKKTFTYRATRAGELPYVCTLHPGMKGIVTVK